MLSTILDPLFKFEISQTIWLQNVLEPMESFLAMISLATQPKNIFLYILPVFVAFSPRFYVKIMIASLSANYVTIVMKWILAEARPYWWIHETNAYTDQSRPDMRQTELTCETSAGNPSGHVMFQAAFLYVIVSESLKIAQTRYPTTYAKTLSVIGWGAYCMVLLLVGVSRMYFGCHFCHQCIIGGTLGYLQTNYILTKSDILNQLYVAKKFAMLKVGASMFLVALIVHFTHIILGVDPLWTIRIAFKWCQNPLYIFPESTPVFSVIRDFGLAFGLFLSAPLTDRFVSQLDLKLSFPVTTLLIVTYSNLIGYVPRHNGIYAFYGSTFMLHFGFVYILLNAMPKLCKRRRQIVA